MRIYWDAKLVPFLVCVMNRASAAKISTRWLCSAVKNSLGESQGDVRSARRFAYFPARGKYAKRVSLSAMTHHLVRETPAFYTGIAGQGYIAPYQGCGGQLGYRTRGRYEGGGVYRHLTELILLRRARTTKDLEGT